MKKYTQILIFILLNSYFSANANNNKTDQSINKDSVFNIHLSNTMVCNIAPMGHHKNIHSALIGDFIAISVSGMDSIVQDSIFNLSDKALPIYLVLDSFICRDIPVYEINYKTHSFIFKLDSSSRTLKHVLTYFDNQWSTNNFSQVSICLNKTILKTKINNFIIYNTSPRILYRVVLIMLLIIITMVVIAKTSNILRTSVDGSNYSLSNVQLCFWTIIILICVGYIWIISGTLPNLPANILALLGISVATSAGSRYVSLELPGNKPKVLLPSKNFFTDIISDDNSANIHRFQMVIWTITLGFIFIYKTLITRQLYEISESYLLLIGISNGAYVVLKISENKGSQTVEKVPPSET